MRQTKADAMEAARAAREERDVLMFALQEACTARPDDEEIVRGNEPGETYTWRLYGSTRMHGGIVVQLFAYPGQRTSVTACYIDRMLTQGWALDANRYAVERLRDRRNERVDAASYRPAVSA